MKSSSSRFTLLRMLTTSMPCCDRRAKMSFRLCSLRDLDLERVVVDQSRHVARRAAGGAAGRAQRKFSTKVSGVSLRDHARHRVVLDDAAAVDDRDVAAEALRLLEVMRGQDDRRAALVDLAQECPTCCGGSRCRRPRSARRGSAGAARAPARARSSGGASCRPTASARSASRLSHSCSCRRYFSDALDARACAGCRRSPPGSR